MNLPSVSQLPCGSESEDEISFAASKISKSSKSKEDPLTKSEFVSEEAAAQVNEHLNFFESGFRVGFCEDKNQFHRRTMEDTHVMKAKFAGKVGQGFFAIFDGHAGKQAAQWCGDHVHELLEDLLILQPDTPIPDLLNETFVSADNSLESKKIYSGCTVVACFVQNLLDRRVLHTANVGDARAVLCRSGKAIRLTYDHKGSDVHEAKRIVEAGGLVLNDRVNGVLAVTRSLGDFTMKSLVVGNPYTTSLDLTPHDEFLILACDGVWDVLSDQEAVDLIRYISDPQLAAKSLVYKSLENMSTDNLSVIIIRILHDQFTTNESQTEKKGHAFGRSENKNLKSEADGPTHEDPDEADEVDGDVTPTQSSVSLALGSKGG